MSKNEIATLIEQMNNYDELAAKVGKKQASFLSTGRARAQLDQAIRKLLME